MGSEFFQKLQKECLPGIWSKGIALQREGAVVFDSVKPDEAIARVRVGNRPVSPKVTLWPADEDWYCDCGEKVEPCAHIAAAAIALKNGAAVEAAKPAAFLEYRIRRIDEKLALERVVVFGERESPVGSSLVAWTGGQSSGRIAFPAPALTKEDFAVDGLASIQKIFALIEASTHVKLDGQPIRVSGKPVGASLEIRDEGDGVRVRKIRDPGIREVFANGAALCDSGLRPFLDTNSDFQEKYFAPRDFAFLVSEFLPSFEIPIENRSSRLPELVDLPPRAEIRVERMGEALSAVATVAYGEPAIAYGVGDRLELLQSKQIPKRDRGAEKTLIRKLQAELHLSPGQVVRYEGEAAVRFARELKRWQAEGKGLEAFSADYELRPRLHAEAGFELEFEATGIGGAKSASAGAVFAAWREGKSLVPLIGGGWAPLPSDWLERYGKRVLALLEARDPSKKLPPQFLPSLAELCEETGTNYPAAIRSLKETLEKSREIPRAALPKGLRAELRSYQQAGVDWLCFLRGAGMGALLADDMGLGKTLQALCAIEGRTLIVCPTSVLQAWSGQIAQFRPDLRVSQYYGSDRKLDSKAEVILTSYSILRLDLEVLGREKWKTLVLDEAQAIKNPESQAARAAHSLQGEFRIALSGTPVENRLEDLWSQFQFLNPGLLGSREDFQEDFRDERRLPELRRRVRPFILRRLKKEVAPELPPRTEIVLQCELNAEERDTYQAILASARTEVLEKLDSGGSVFAALEVLLRLRQACCHSRLLPGGIGPVRSSKVELLLETLQESISSGHRALVFSQWTSFLDLLEPELRALGISFSRLDGSTADREEVVQRFQREDGPSVFLLSLKAGGVGLTLTAADHVFLLDPWWNPAAEDQAADRAHRIGQKNPVLIHKLVARDTVEDRILVLQQKKIELAQAVLSSGGAGALSMTRDDLIALLS